MDAATVANILQLPVQHCASVLTKYSNDHGEIERAVSLYLENQSGPFKQGGDAPSGDGWAESGKSRRSKKVRKSCAEGRGRPRAEGHWLQQLPDADALSR